MTASFSDSEKKLLYGQSPKLAAKHGCSSKYVKMIINGERKINFPTAKKIHADLLALIELLSPNTTENE
ncbi:MAG: hypothetical protein QM499_08460 [Flavobacteriaceae bacterium]